MEPGTMDITDIILREEIEFPKLFASYLETDYGILFYNEDEKDSYDSNHAILFPDRASCLDGAINDVTEFYLSKGIVPRVYSPLIDGFFEKHRNSFEKRGYTIERYEDMCFMLLEQENTIRVDSKLDIVRLSRWDARIGNDIFIPNSEKREIEVVRNSLRSEDYYLFVGYLDGVAVTTTSFHISQYGCTRFDYITTAREYRQRGYARELIGFVVDYCRERNLPNCYQWPAHPASAKICHEAGFRGLFRRQGCSAVYNA